MKSDAIKIAKKFVVSIKTNGVPITTAYLFGSYAKGNAKPYSDIDICIISPSLGKDMIDEMDKLRQKYRKIDDRIEALPFGTDDINNPYDPLAAEIRCFGQPII